MSEDKVDLSGFDFTPGMVAAIQATTSDPKGVLKTIESIQAIVREYVRINRISNRNQVIKNIFATTMAVVFWAEHRHVRGDMLRGFYDKFIDYVAQHDVGIPTEDLRYAVWRMVDDKSLSAGNIRMEWNTYME